MKLNMILFVICMMFVGCSAPVCSDGPEHKYGNWSYVVGDNSRKCTVCGWKDTSCDTGTKCRGDLSHKYGMWNSIAGSSSQYRQCMVCGWTESTTYW